MSYKTLAQRLTDAQEALTRLERDLAHCKLQAAVTGNEAWPQVCMAGDAVRRAQEILEGVTA